MNTDPDESLIVRWMDGELSENERVQMENWAADKPDILALREQQPVLREGLRHEQPHGDFFVSQVMRKIEREAAQPEPALQHAPGLGERLMRYFIPASFALMAFSFWLGTAISKGSSGEGAVASVGELYTADSRVQARLEGGGDDPTVIVLSGWETESDALELVHSDIELPRPAPIVQTGLEKAPLATLNF